MPSDLLMLATFVVVIFIFIPGQVLSVSLISIQTVLKQLFGRRLTIPTEVECPMDGAATTFLER